MSICFRDWIHQYKIETSEDFQRAYQFKCHSILCIPSLLLNKMMSEKHIWELLSACIQVPSLSSFQYKGGLTTLCIYMNILVKTRTLENQREASLNLPKDKHSPSGRSDGQNIFWPKDFTRHAETTFFCLYFLLSN